jgi:serine O-acetyltransferase
MIDALTLQRAAHALHRRGVPVLPRVLRRAILHLYGSALDPELELPRDTQLGYGGLGIVIHRGVRMGRRVLVSHGVTLGGRDGHDGLPVVEDDVKIGAGAKVLGPVRLGRGARVGANAVVLRDVPAGATVAGVPAREIAARSANAAGGLGLVAGDAKE